MSNYKTMYKDKLSKLLFLEMNKEGFKRSLNIPEGVNFKNDDLYLPISSDYVVSNVNDEVKLSNLPIYYFVEGIFITFGADKNVKYNDDYGTILSYIPDAEECVKSLIADRIKKDRLEDAYILLKGLYRYTREEEILTKLLAIGETIREKDSGFSEILLEDIEEFKEKFEKSPEPHLYNALILKDDGDYKGAEVEINEYINKGGKKTDEIDKIIGDITNISHFEKAVEYLKDEPKKAIELLLPLSEEFNENPLVYYYLGVGYRRIENYNKAIHYLNKSLTIESGSLETVNELGMNYACIGEYEEAIKYFRKAFEASKEVEICTNIVMCYINLGDKEQAKIHLELAKKIAPEDDIVIEIDQMLNRTIK
ncbi:tetratricopeptide repeat protein [Clostridium beijerinckii]|jgi:Flp pilus assembly protein TadD, contains TPR repeats|uniref:Tetratricopeptide repeat protein n=2 Tax=Clostridium beijerinckii TaxID=1520 RepID=A0AAE2RKM6_CLOBE|nr:tetratricopeptide repeat protein [Clostridium beijerinckii]ABR33168.1 Tetratricopeptide TPR_2 repeat protein [Clostridium beijerinckii NCIMB 8052]AIU03928.1 TPR repeat-containing protein [Clostridium beijerinckii ATCC 35702]MBF7807152.1 tetratricopeptide repeat protein [Clostridium beijerinckii]NOW93019.1 tetratricopeptide (TPR) repeat protein [Clostridium beijerinckii]NRT25585.1 tetratricopeptide (TPR) repeat protein [Clostridium beijerinckii]